MNNTQLLRLNWWQRSQASVPINLLSFSCVQENGIFEMPSAETLHGCAVRRLHFTYFLLFLQPFLNKCPTHYTFDSRCILFFLNLSSYLSVHIFIFLSTPTHSFLSRYQVIVCTCGTAGAIGSLFDHQEMHPLSSHSCE
jgi:hypothetical protein